MFRMRSEGDLPIDGCAEHNVMEGADNVCHEQRLLEGTSACDEATESVSGYDGDSHRRG